VQRCNIFIHVSHAIIYTRVLFFFEMLRLSNQRTHIPKTTNQKENSRGRLIIGFRGTTTPLDNCADWKLFAFWTPMPLACKSLERSLFLRYPVAAAEFTDHVLATYCPKCDILYTGHSLGAGMAELEALRSNGARPSVAFSSPGMKHYVNSSPTQKHALRTEENNVCECECVFVRPPTCRVNIISRLISSY
jgi:hypothetical protein